jgi:hypothetical protein
VPTSRDTAQSAEDARGSRRPQSEATLTTESRCTCEIHLNTHLKKLMITRD